MPNYVPVSSSMHPRTASAQPNRGPCHKEDLSLVASKQLLSAVSRGRSGHDQARSEPIPIVGSRSGERCKSPTVQLPPVGSPHITATGGSPSSFVGQIPMPAKLMKPGLFADYEKAFSLSGCYPNNIFIAETAAETAKCAAVIDSEFTKSAMTKSGVQLEEYKKNMARLVDKATDCAMNYSKKQSSFFINNKNEKKKNDDTERSYLSYKNDGSQSSAKFGLHFSQENKVVFSMKTTEKNLSQPEHIKNNDILSAEWADKTVKDAIATKEIFYRLFRKKSIDGYDINQVKFVVDSFLMSASKNAFFASFFVASEERTITLTSFKRVLVELFSSASGKQGKSESLARFVYWARDINRNAKSLQKKNTFFDVSEIVSTREKIKSHRHSYSDNKNFFSREDSVKRSLDDFYRANDDARLNLRFKWIFEPAADEELFSLCAEAASYQPGLLEFAFASSSRFIDPLTKWIWSEVAKNPPPKEQKRSQMKPICSLSFEKWLKSDKFDREKIIIIDAKEEGWVIIEGQANQYDYTRAEDIIIFLLNTEKDYTKLELREKPRKLFLAENEQAWLFRTDFGDLLFSHKLSFDDGLLKKHNSDLGEGDVWFKRAQNKDTLWPDKTPAQRFERIFSERPYQNIILELANNQG